MRFFRAVLILQVPLLLILSACEESPTYCTQPAVDCAPGYRFDMDRCDCVRDRCVATVDPGHPRYARFEGIGFENACRTDRDCIAGGCSSEVCAAESVISTCELLPDKPSGSCGCLEGTCSWMRCGG